MRFLYLTILSGLLFCACSYEDGLNALTQAVPGCDVLNPTQELSWLKAEIDQRDQNPSPDMKYCYILQGNINGKVVFVYEDCNPLANKLSMVLNCEGTVINTLHGVNNSDVQNKTIIWRTKDYVCNPIL